MKQMNSLIRCILDFYNLQRMENPAVLERMKEGNSEEWVMDRLERAIFNDCDKEAKASKSYSFTLCHMGRRYPQFNLEGKE